MKGFGIYVQNDLLEPKHYEAIGSAIWIYLWCLDKMTSINEEGIGIVLGGKPVKLEDIQKDLSLTDRTYTRYITRLQQNGYISTIRTPYGYIIKVTKAKKQFGKRTVKVAGRTVTLAGENRKSGGNKEDKTVDNTNTTANAESLLASKENDMGWNNKGDDYDEYEVQVDPDFTPKGKIKKQTARPEVLEVFDLFENPAKKVWPMRPTERAAAEALLEAFGIEVLERRMKRIKLEQKKEDPYFPDVFSPSQLLEKMPKIERYLKS